VVAVPHGKRVDDAGVVEAPLQELGLCLKVIQLFPVCACTWGCDKLYYLRVVEMAT
jgi:hypothetical protein